MLLTPRCADPLYRRSVKVSMGTVFQVPWARIDDAPTGLAVLRATGFDLAALALRDDAVGLDRYAASRPERVALALGTEGAGLSSRMLDAADAVVTIPMHGGVDSLNVASAAAIALWEISRDRRPR